MTKPKERDEALGRFLSLVLRHNPAAAGIQLDANGWADVRELIAGCNQAGKTLDIETLERIVRENDKQRYRFNADRSKIRANQGHSLSVDVELKEAIPPESLYHGTVPRFLEHIQAEGIQKRSRQHVHLSADISTAVNVGDRRGEAIVLRVDASAMHRDGHRFYRSENGVWLCDVVPWQYVTVMETDR